jgi:hypothetical protein
MIAGMTWYVAHRYTDFSLLKTFLLSQNPGTAEFKAVPGMFPGKAVGLAFRKGLLLRRVEGLAAFLVYFLQNARFCRQTSIDALCSFLEVNVLPYLTVGYTAEPCVPGYFCDRFRSTCPRT